MTTVVVKTKDGCDEYYGNLSIGQWFLLDERLYVKLAAMGCNNNAFSVGEGSLRTISNVRVTLVHKVELTVTLSPRE